MWNTEKKINKRLIGAVIGSAVIGGLSMTPKGKSFWRRMLDKSTGWTDFLKSGAREMVKTRENLRKK